MGKLILYPNPANGTQPVTILVPRGSLTNVRVQIFTVAFRKVLEENLLNPPLGVPIAVNLTDKSGVPLASGLYYVVVTTNQGRYVGKLIVLR